MLNIPVETEKRGLPVDDLVASLIEATGDTEQNVMARIASWQKKDSIVIREVREIGGQIRFFAWKRDPKVVAQENRSAWLDRVNALGGLEEVIFGNIPREKVIKAVFGL